MLLTSTRSAGIWMPNVAADVGRTGRRGSGTEVDLDRRRIRWHPAYRLIASRFPPIDLFERVADAADLDAVIELESLTNDRLRQEAGEIHLVPPADRVAGPGAGYVMAPFTHLHPSGGRFTDAAHGAYYAARTLETAIAETTHHRARFLRATRQPSMEIDMRLLEAYLDAQLHDLRGRRDNFPEVYDPDDYSAGQALARRLRASGSDGIVYDSVRHAGGTCAAVFRPKRIRNCRATRHLTYVWNGRQIVQVYEKSPI
jgi:hypothetical protein